MLFLAVFFLGLGPVPFILNVELIPPEARVSGSQSKSSKSILITSGSVLLVRDLLQLGDLLPGGTVHPQHRRRHWEELLLLHLLRSKSHDNDNDDDDDNDNDDDRWQCWGLSLSSSWCQRRKESQKMKSRRCLRPKKTSSL